MSRRPGELTDDTLAAQLREAADSWPDPSMQSLLRQAADQLEGEEDPTREVGRALRAASYGRFGRPERLLREAGARIRADEKTFRIRGD